MAKPKTPQPCCYCGRVSLNHKRGQTLTGRTVYSCRDAIECGKCIKANREAAALALPGSATEPRPGESA